MNQTERIRIETLEAEIEYLRSIFIPKAEDLLVDYAMLRYKLTHSEALVFAQICSRALVTTREMIYTTLYPLDAGSPDSRVVDVFVSKIRSKLKKSRSSLVIEGVWGRGYRFTDESYSYIKALKEQLSNHAQLPAHI